MELMSENSQTSQSSLWKDSFFAFAHDIKISHTIFALPFVGTSLLISDVSALSLSQIFFVLICMISARSFAMGINRVFDAEFDRDNTRTMQRALPAGRLSWQRCLALSLMFGFLFVVFAFQLSAIAGFLAFPTLIVLGSYSLMKRWTWLTHWYLGFCLGLAPLAAQVALTETVTAPVVLLGLAVAAWTAGFDLMYSLQDMQFDREKRLFSIPAKFGHRAALLASICSFLVMLFCLGGVGVQTKAGFMFYVGVAGVASILAYEHWLIRDAWHNGYSRNINAAFFTSNAFVSVLIFTFSALDRWIHVP